MTFEQYFSVAPSATVATPGRVNLIGEHTDYNDGFVLPTVIPQTTVIQIAPRKDKTVRVVSSNMQPAAVHTYALGAEKKSADWLVYIQGVTHILRTSGITISGFDALISSTVPTGAGLSSSAALTVGLIKALREVFPFDLTDPAIARLAQRVENEFVGAHVGIMDQMAVCLARPRQALFLDTRSLHYELVTLPEKAGLIVINSGVSHSNIGGGYSARRRSCEEAATQLKVKALRDLGLADLGRLKPLGALLEKRARPVISENARVESAVLALKAGDLARLGQLFNESHASMRDDYEVSTPEIDQLVNIANLDPAVYGARLTGGGFGGSIVALANLAEAPAAAKRIAQRYLEQVGKEPTILVP
ncbi:MAG: galactokinase [Proteobacteria bacterium]|nr:galactokinase [Pseudomonadota bacterium]